MNDLEKPSPSGWMGARGEGYVVVQFILLTLLVLGPSAPADAGGWPQPFGLLGKISGGLLMAAGLAMCALGFVYLGQNLTPLPRPREDAYLVVNGPYRWVRHPIYSGIILAAFGLALVYNGIFTLGYAFLLLGFFHLKSRREEEWLSEKFPEYREYQQRVRKLIPFVF